MDYKDYIVEVQDFPINGVNFKDISPLLADEHIYESTIVDMGNLVDADLSFRKACELEPLNSDAHNNLGFVLAFLIN